MLLIGAGWLILSDRYGVFTNAEYTAEYRPPPLNERNVSLIMLPAACFIDKQLHNETFAVFQGDQARLDAVGAVSTGAYRFETAIWGSIMNFNLKRDDTTVDVVRPGRPKKWWMKMFVVMYWFAPLVAGAAVLGWTMVYIVGIKDWMHNSGWISEEGKFEKGIVRGFGEIAPLVAVGAVFLAAFEKWVWPVPKLKED
ncbi:hypothetical protein QC761_0096910 [Podospora bellae-mahoneyi]|uniref:Uncharacterized protein n=1 Tax=Podospora bellae-mahoneyi TaxID=2093777 RepID=A0ABR0FAA8_9PEZI|nr:hypothetical protein QC761_0096910 [Podospora bellae-mahoneyi]